MSFPDKPSVALNPDDLSEARSKPRVAGAYMSK